jgi:hypothetical protein
MHQLLAKEAQEGQEESNGEVMKEILIKLSVPDEVDPHEVLTCMIDDFFYSNRNTEDFGPHMENITITTVKEEK